jgi:hypothetical protein
MYSDSSLHNVFNIMKQTRYQTTCDIRRPIPHVYTMSNFFPIQCTYCAHVRPHHPSYPPSLSNIPIYSQSSLFCPPKPLQIPSRHRPGPRTTTLSTSTHTKILSNKTKTTIAMSYQSTYAQGAGRQSPTDEIINMLDEHLAWQIESDSLPWDDRSFVSQYRAYQAQAAQREARRKSSLGTLIVDGREVEVPQGQAGTMTQALNHQNTLPSEAPSRHDSVLASSLFTRIPSPSRKLLPSPPSPQHFTAHYSHTQNIVHGLEPSIHYTYDYNGNIIHIHHSDTLQSSQVSEYFDLPVEEYVPDTPFRVTEKPLPALPVPLVPVKDKVVGFVKKVVQRLDSSGIWGSLRKEGQRRRKGRKKSNLETWVVRGYVT